MAMSKLLERAMEEARKLPESDQDSIGAALLAEIDGGRRWEQLFAPPWAGSSRIADAALAEYGAERTLPADADMDAWDRQIERDVAEGKLDKLFEKARADHRAGKSKEL
jgi:hypothetical protein